MGTGYGWVQKGLSDQLLHMPLYVVLLLPLARIVATALSIGTGGSGGVFGPGMVIGAFTGLAVWRLLEPFAPGVGHEPAAFIVVGMMAVFGGISRAPLAVMLMVAEMTGSVALLAPAMVAVAISTFIVSRDDDSIYRSQLRTRAASPGARLQSAMPLLSRSSVTGTARPPRLTLRPDMTATEALTALRTAAVPGAPVTDAHGIYLGTVAADAVGALAEQAPKAPVDQVLDSTAPTAPASATLDVALEAMSQAGGHWVTVTDEARQVVGVLAVNDFVTAYRQALQASFGQLSRVSGHALTLELQVGPSSPVLGAALKDAGLPPGCIVVAVQRGEQLVFPSGATILAEGDLVSVLAGPGDAGAVTLRISGPRPVGTATGDRGPGMV